MHAIIIIGNNYVNNARATFFSFFGADDNAILPSMAPNMGLAFGVKWIILTVLLASGSVSGSDLDKAIDYLNDLIAKSQVKFIIILETGSSMIRSKG